MDIRIGNGFDVHRLVPDRRLILCGVEIPYHLGLLGHSDADVAIHALADALLGATASGDIGHLFPDTDPAYEGADSRILLRKVMELLASKGYRVGNADITIMAQAPKMAPHIGLMRRNMAEDMNIDIDRVAVKATTTERLGFTGRGEGIAAMASVIVCRE
ncbi:MAG: 2-C-methyl-D-erythritol 2,4-cyclodiphosphate synthase [Paramuribaculum sp.]|nr:2-C-methyl-D-erythritol 2,4-cyclodiphosphate synthase [Paramuribaculum sp.]MDE7471143.1 2-C-methyl-D-erythritol 2,4-cyclodiphosphate synthase [Paramuribaculum sp.]